MPEVLSAIITRQRIKPPAKASSFRLMKYLRTNPPSRGFPQHQNTRTGIHPLRRRIGAKPGRRQEPASKQASMVIPRTAKYKKPKPRLGRRHTNIHRQGHGRAHHPRSAIKGNRSTGLVASIDSAATPYRHPSPGQGIACSFILAACAALECIRPPFSRSATRGKTPWPAAVMIKSPATFCSFRIRRVPKAASKTTRGILPFKAFHPVRR